MAKVSIIIPIYKVEKYLKQCIDSILAQTYKDFELILVNDGSPDGCGNICEEYKKSDNRITVIHKENGGLVSACTIGIMQSTSEFICFVDGDDWISDNFLEVLLKNQKTTDADIVCCQAMKEYENYNINYKLTTLNNGLYQLDHLVDKLINDGNLGSKVISNSRCGKLLKTSIVKNNLSFYREDIVNGEDQQLIVPVLLECKRVSILSDFYSYHYRYNNNSITGSYVENFWCKLIMLNSHLKNILKDYNYNFTIQQNNELISFAILSILNEYKHKVKFIDRYRVFNRICNDKELIFAIDNSNIKINSIHKKILFSLIKYRFSFLVTLFEDIYQFRNKIKRKIK